MKCPKCGKDDDKVLDSRSLREGATIRRRRECLLCHSRWTTYEEIMRDDTTVVKRDGRRELFNRKKLERAIAVACGKRPISDVQIRQMLDEIVSQLDPEEVPSDRIAELAMSALQKVDKVAYVRFASVYRTFTDVGQFVNAVEELPRP